MIILEVRDLSKSYGASTTVLRDICLEVEQGEFLGIIGLSGAGKSTLLRCINRLIEPTSGEIFIPRSVFVSDADGYRSDILKLSRRELRLLRRKVGMIFQQFNIVKRFTVIENVLSGALGYQSSLKSFLNLFSQKDKRQALVNLKRVGLLDHAYKRADEPVSSLDPKLSRVILDILKKVCREDGITALVSLHTLDLTKEYADRIVGLNQGQILFDGPTKDLTTPMVETIYRASL